MTRISIEKAVEAVGNRFDLVLIAAQRAHQLQQGLDVPSVPCSSEEKAPVTALREIEAKQP